VRRLGMNERQQVGDRAADGVSPSPELSGRKDDWRGMSAAL
jgi:hypothetical protein